MKINVIFISFLFCCVYISTKWKIEKSMEKLFAFLTFFYTKRRNSVEQKIFLFGKHLEDTCCIIFLFALSSLIF